MVIPTNSFRPIQNRSLGSCFYKETNEYKEGDTVEFDKVLLVDNGTDATIGTPYIAGAKVKAVYQGEKKGKKLSIVRFKAKSNRDRKIGHRQKYARVKIESLV